MRGISANTCRNSRSRSSHAATSSLELRDSASGSFFSPSVSGSLSPVMYCRRAPNTPEWFTCQVNNNNTDIFHFSLSFIVPLQNKDLSQFLWGFNNPRRPASSSPTFSHQFFHDRNLSLRGHASYVSKYGQIFVVIGAVLVEVKVASCSIAPHCIVFIYIHL